MKILKLLNEDIPHYLLKSMHIMRIGIFLLFIVIAQLHAESSYSQNVVINLSLKNVTVEQVLNQIEKNTEFSFLFTDKSVDTERVVDVEINKKNISETLAILFKGTDVQYRIVDKQVILSDKSYRIDNVKQAKQIKGVIADMNGEPIIGANVVEKGTTNGTITDTEGRFSLQVAPGATLIISYIGYVTDQVAVGDKKSLSITMREDSEALDEVIVVGYGTQKKANLTGAVEAVKGQELTKRPVMSTSLALQGLASGVTVTSSSGQPGKEGEAIRIRGIGTMNNNDPLVLVDGVASSVNAVNPNDIESISILKDAASSSIYGSRASNGVILITTKRAKTNDFAINFSANVGFQTPVDLPKFLGAIDYLNLYDMASANDNRKDDGTLGGVVYGKEYINNYKANMANDPYRYPNTDWADVTYNSPAVQQSYK